ncbi:hypothetical protein V500_03084 [Pseudogymnoascus sp. VKM F-4518 (FW-2643)]|nr:hypothetical protein V500_03084 [Pseudogymnoascus sp. VKM F-4518 (FW-2643)]
MSRVAGYAPSSGSIVFCWAELCLSILAEGAFRPISTQIGGARRQETDVSKLCSESTAMGLGSILTASLLALSAFAPVSAAPSPVDALEARSGSFWWLPNIKRQGAVPGNASFKVFRNVMDYGATGDGSSDDTAAINAAITDGNRCGQGCDSSTTTPALIYFPPGTYIVSKPIIQYYYTQLVGDAVEIPTIKAAVNFLGIAVIDSNPYAAGGVNWYTSQNNFFRQIRNFKIDLTGQPKSTGTGIYWHVAQATSLQNIEFNMIKDKSSDNKQQGIFMDKGSGGFMTDLTFNGGNVGVFWGSQQFTTRNLKFNGCRTAIYMNWNWAWTLQGLAIDSCDIGLDMSSNGQDQQNVGAVIVQDSTFSNTPVGIATRYSTGQNDTSGTLIIDNVDFSKNCPNAVQNPESNTAILQGNTKVQSWVQGRAYSAAGGSAVQGTQSPVSKPSALLDDSGNIFTKSKPQYENVDASKFVSVKSKGAKGDGVTDDTAAIQAAFNSVSGDQIVYFDHGNYVITNTVNVPKNVKIVGEIWPVIFAGGDSNFQDQNNPKPVFQVGNAGDVGTVEIQDLIFSTMGPQPGAILMEFNVAGQDKGSAGLWDVHFRIGGFTGTQMQSDKCSKTPSQTTQPNPQCIGAFMLMHITPQASAYLENTWFWVADHELDLGDHDQINIYNGRGILIESTKGAWLWGTSSEHSVLVNFQLSNAKNVYMGLIQAETAYMQGNPDAKVPFKYNAKYSDPDFSKCTGPKCARTWGLRAVDSSDILIYGAGLYSLFDNYDQTCVDANNCQDSILDIENSSVHIFGLATKASVNMNGDETVPGGLGPKTGPSSSAEPEPSPSATPTRSSTTSKVSDHTASPSKTAHPDTTETTVIYATTLRAEVLKGNGVRGWWKVRVVQTKSLAFYNYETANAAEPANWKGPGDTKRKRRLRTSSHFKPSPTQDHLLHLIHVNVLRGLFDNKVVLLSHTSYLAKSDGAEGLQAIPAEQAFPGRAAIMSTASDLPKSLRPTPLQNTVVHATCIDLMPFPSIRDNLIEQEGRFSWAELTEDLVGYLLDPSCFFGPQCEQKPSIAEEPAPYYGDDDDLTANRNGIIVWGAPHRPESWEVTSGFLRKWELWKGTANREAKDFHIFSRLLNPEPIDADYEISGLPPQVPTFDLAT